MADLQINRACMTTSGFSSSQILLLRITQRENVEYKHRTLKTKKTIVSMVRVLALRLLTHPEGVLSEAHSPVTKCTDAKGRFVFYSTHQMRKYRITTHVLSEI